MPKKDRTLAPQVEYAINTARVAGQSERAIYENLRDILDTPPSYRDVRAALSNSGLRYKSQATAARHAKGFPASIREGVRPIKHSEYLERLKTLKRVSRRPESVDELNRAYLIGYLARGGIDPTALADSELSSSLMNIYEGRGS